eukprot:TRINITY_DN41254_c0_g1_i1.p1 TRINITY_DN41254_c0_g1~~TRINITY_DN41254_c0_g1_i1.p1  ORF type:complete len:604 (+),score=126.63 TRINITY_DN41254_c0_g1_i1:110-1921(+)
MDGLAALVTRLQQTPARAQAVLTQLLVLLDDVVTHPKEDKYRSVDLDDLPGVVARVLLSCGFLEVTPGILTLPGTADLERLASTQHKVTVLLQKANQACLPRSTVVNVPRTIIDAGSDAAAALRSAAKRVSPLVSTGSLFVPGDHETLRAGKASRNNSRHASKDDLPKPEPLKVPQAVQAAAAAVTQSATRGGRGLANGNRGAGRAPEAPAGGRSTWLAAPPGMAAESRIVVQLPEADFRYIERPSSHFVTRWAAMDFEMERIFGQHSAFTIVDLGSCSGFFSVQAAVGYPQCTVVGVEGAVGVGNGTVGVQGTQAEIIETKAVQTHLSWIQKLKLPNGLVAPEVWDYRRICGFAALGRPITDVMMSLSVVHHIDNISERQYEEDGMDRVTGTTDLMSKLLLLAPRHFIELPDRPWIQHIHDHYGNARAFLQAAADLTGKQWKWVGPLVHSIWYGNRELWLLEDAAIGDASSILSQAMPVQGLKALFPRMLSLQNSPGAQAAAAPAGRASMMAGYPGAGGAGAMGSSSSGMVASPGARQAMPRRVSAPVPAAGMQGAPGAIAGQHFYGAHPQHGGMAPTSASSGAAPVQLRGLDAVRGPAYYG